MSHPNYPEWRSTRANALSPALMTASECLDEVADILAAGVLRLVLRRSVAEAENGRRFDWTVPANRACVVSNHHGECR